VLLRLPLLNPLPFSPGKGPLDVPNSSDPIRSTRSTTHNFGLDGPPPRLVCFIGDVLEDMIHLFRGTTAGLGNEEEGPDKREEKENGEECVGTESRLHYQRRRDRTDFEIVEPI